ncbi:beta strand repeat-containing protein, partial [Mariniflexile sp. HMF6888]|uniref:beta strand repeat-containing protein n=1 Tax=Mariniflexile sp. HMF6888 TaxID=3373086 RepID=UPI00378B1DB2
MSTNRNTPFIKFMVLTMLSWLNYTGLMAQSYPPVFDVTTLNGANGFAIPGIQASSQFGAETRFIGDINNDGLEDIAIVAPSTTVNSVNSAGTVYIIFGSNAGFPASFDITSLDGTNGFIVEGVVEYESIGLSVEGVGDINGDGIDDLIVGASRYGGGILVIYGKPTNVAFNAAINRGDIDGNNGFIISTTGFLLQINQIGSLGDVNGDNINDFILGKSIGGQAWIFFGQAANFPLNIDSTWLDGVKGFQTSSFPSSRASYNVGGAGDINSDGINDILIGSWNGSLDINEQISYALFGKSTPFDVLVDLPSLDGTDGFKIDNQGNGLLTFVGPIGDVNGDGIDDCFSENDIIFGSSSAFPASLLQSNLNGTNGFLLNNYVLCAAPTGDLNRDGIDDFIVASKDDYVIFGKTGGFSATFNSASLDGTNGFKIVTNNSTNGRPIDGGKDVNGDGFTDFIFSDTKNAKQVYVVFGGDHYAVPLTTGYPQAVNETSTGFTLLVNGPETGTIHYAIYPGSYSTTVTHDAILNGTGAMTQGSFAMNIENTDVSEVISSLTANPTYDVYLFLEDGAGNQGEIYQLNDVTTLVVTTDDTEAPTITCPINQELACNSTSIPDYTGLVTATDNQDPNPVITQSPAAGTKFTDGMTITITATDASNNANSCTFIVTKAADTDKPVLTCLTSESLFVNSTLPNYYLKLGVSDNCTSLFDLTYTQTPVQGTVFTADTNVTVSVTDDSGNTESCSFLVTVKSPIAPTDCNTTSISTNDLNGSNGFQIDGNKIKGELGYDVRGAGDINGDGIEDFLVGAPSKAYQFNTPYGEEKGNFPGDVFVIFGKGNDFLPNLDTALLDGTNGFKITNDIPGGLFQSSGLQVSTAGDINNDGIDDLMFSDPFRHDSFGLELGTIYVVFGKTSGFPAVFNVSDIDGTNGFVFMGADNYDQSGYHFDSAGDINNDGINDIIIGANTGRGTNNPGKCYIIYGSSTAFPALIKGGDLNGTNGFIIKGDVDGDKIGNWVAGLGDVNGDGIDDVGFGGGNKNKTYVLFGKTGSFSSIVATATINGTTGFYVDSGSLSKKITGVGDVNNDGINDMLFGNKKLLFGKNTGFSVPEDITSLDGANGIELTGDAYIVSSAGGDFNNDGIDDLIVGKYGSIAIVYGKDTPWSATLNPFLLSSSEAFVINRSDYSDYSVSDLGDINGDGITDVITGKKEKLYYDSSSSLDPGHAHVIYGFSVTDTEPPVITTCPGDQILVSGNILPDYTSLATATDNCDAAPVITQSPIAGSVYTSGMTITLIATDKKGNTSNCTFIVSDNTDTEAPTITCPPNQELACNTTSIPDYTGLVTATDNQDPNPAITQSPVAGTAFTDGMT